MDPVVVVSIAFTALGVLASLAGVLWSWMIRRRTSVLLRRVSSIRIRYADIELSIRDEKATPAEIEDLITTITEKRDEPGETTPQIDPPGR